MALKYVLKDKRNVLWSIILGVTFVCCNLLIYYTVHNYGRWFSSRMAFPSSSPMHAEMLSADNCKSVCSSEDCIDMAYDIIEYMNPSVDPCEDFYQFACGNFKEKYGPKSNYSSFRLQHDRLQRTVRDVIETSEETRYPDSAAQKLKTLYDSCMDTKSLELTDIRRMQTLLSEIGIKNWPKLDSDFVFTNPTLEEALGRLLTFEEEIFFELDYNYDVLKASTPYYQCKNCTDEVMENIVTGLLRYIGTDQENIKIVWDSFVDVENAIAELKKMNKSEEAKDCDDDDDDESCETDCETESLQTKRFIIEVADSMIRHGEMSTRFVAENVSISCNDVQEIETLTNFLKSYNQRALAHYIAMRVILDNLKFMNFAYRKQYEIFRKRKGERRGKPLEIERWKFCVSYIVKNMNLPLGLMYVTELFSQEAIDEIDDMVHAYQKATSQFILAQEDLPAATKRKIIKEIENVKHLITDVIKSIQQNRTTGSPPLRVDNSVSEFEHQTGVSDRETKYTRKHFARKIEKEKNYIIDVINLFKNKTQINEAYEKFHPRSDDFLYNVLQLNKRGVIADFMGYSNVEKQMNKYALEDRIFEVNAINFQGIHLLFGLLLPPFYKYEHPKLFKTARLGEIIAHEIGHTVYAVLQDKKKKDNGTRLYVEENIDCRHTQYSEFELQRIGQKLKPNKTENDDFADTVAVQVTEKIVESLFENAKERMFALPGTNFTAYELFYILFAQSYCKTTSIERERRLWEMDAHSPDRYRVIGVFQNSKKFPEVFNCSETAYMNPQNKCPVFY